MADRKIDPKLDELLSAFLDGEASTKEAHILLDRLGRDPGLGATLDLHHRLRASLRGELHPGLDDDFASRVMAGIEAAEGGHGHPNKVIALKTPHRMPPVLRTAIGLAMAASIAAVAVLSVQTLLPSTGPAFPALTTDESHNAAAIAKPETIEVADQADRRDQRWDDLSPDAAAELNNYLLSHNNSAIDHGFGGSMGFMRATADDGVDFVGTGR